MDLRFIAVRPLDGGLEVVRDDDFGYPTEGLKGPHRRANPVGPTLCPRRLSIGGVGSTPDGNEHLCLVQLPALAVDDRKSLAGVIDKEFLPGAVMLAHDHIELPCPLPIRLAEPTVLEALGRSCLVFLPQQE